MTNLNKTLKIGLAATLLSVTTAASATTVTVTASATVDNAIDMTFTGSLGFGTIRANVAANDDECVGLVLSADTSVTTLSAATTETTFAANCANGAGSAVITSIDGSISRPEFTITGVPAFQSLSFSSPADAELTLTGTPPGAATFQLIDYTAFQTNATPAAAVTFGATALTADTNGEVTFTMGAILATDDAASGLSDYQDAAYSGTFDVTVTY